MTRLFFSGRAVIRKEPLGRDAERRLGQEVAMLERLRGVVGVVQLVEAPRYPGSVVLEDVGGRSLAEVSGPLAVDELIELAVDLAAAVAGMHRRGVMHRDVTPANIVIGRDGKPCLVDFALSTPLAEIRPAFVHHTEIMGTLAYLAPEQTGRTGRSVDHRADLYALGATLYELATGEPPFGSGDPLRLTHDLLARVPTAPVELDPNVPAPLSGIVMHLLEKEPDNRYQTADGVVYDLERLRDAQARPASAAVRIGEHDVPLRLLPPSRLVGRDDEVAALHGAFVDALTGGCRGVLVSGTLGVGKTALVDQLRPVVAERDGWFVAGRFDQHRHDLEFDAVNQAFRALGRLLLAEPEEELTDVRQRILEAVGPNAGLLTAAVPEFAALLGVAPEPGDSLTAQVRAQRTAVDLLRAVASPKRPLVVFLDDLQWAGRAPLGVVDLVFSEKPIQGLLLVGACRDGDIDASHPRAALLSRWRDQAGVRCFRLDNLPESGSATIVAEVLRMDPAAAADLVEAVHTRTSGNPFETLELLGALRRDGLLNAGAAGWRWEAATVRARLGRAEVTGLSAAHVEALPERSRQMLEAMACLGGRAELRLLQTATAEPAPAVEQALAPALDERLLVVEPGLHDSVRFRHDRTREVILLGLDRPRRRLLQLAMARRLAGKPELFAVAAEQYLPVVDAVEDAAERRVVVGLLRRAADQAALTGGYVLVDALLAGALRLIGPGDIATLVELHTGRHAALFSLGRLDEADEEYRSIERLSVAALERADATAVQLRSLTHRNRYAEAIGLGVESLRQLGIAVPAVDQLSVELDQRFDYLDRWLDQTDQADDPARLDITDPALLAAARLLNAILPAAYFADPSVQAWLSLEAFRIWLEHGPTRTLVGTAGVAAFHAVALRGDAAGGYRAVRRILSLGEARGYAPDTAQVRSLFAVLSCWFEPIENGVQPARQAREELIAGGDPANAGYTYYPTVSYLLDCGSSLDDCVAEVDAGLAFVRRSGIEQTGESLDSYRWLTDVLRGERSAATGDANPIERYADNPLALLHAHVNHAIAAAVFGDPVGLGRHTTAAMSLLPVAPGLYVSAVARLLYGLALAEQARASDGDERGGLLTKLDDVTRWHAARAADAPSNFLHLLRLVEAERAWAVGDFRAAVLAFDAAQHEAAQRQRPWHRALIAERAARFYLAHAVDHAGYSLLAEARQEYLAWGATAKVNQMDWAYPALRPQPDASTGQRGSAVTTGTIDLLGILSASQALSSETSIERLHSRLAKVLSAMTGATGVQLLLWSEDRKVWLLPAPSGERATVPVSGTGDDGLVPMSVLRYARRTGEPLVVSDATRDDRFARDPYFTDISCCSLLVLPILSRGSVQALLVLENRLMRGAFSTQRLDAVKLIAGQLAVSLENAQVYAEFRRVADEQAALRRVATLVAEAAPPATVFATVAEEVGRLLAVDGAAVRRYLADGTAEILAQWSRSGEIILVGPRAQPVRGTVTATVRETGRAARVDRYTDAAGGAAREMGIRSTVGAPITVGGELWGLVAVVSTGEEPPSAGTEERLGGFTELVATAIANAQARGELRTIADEQAALRRLATLVAAGASPADVFAAVAEEVGRLLSVEGAFVVRYEPDEAITILAGRSTSGRSLPIGLRTPITSPSLGSVVRETGRPARIDHYADHPVALEYGVRSSAAAPITVQGRLWGYIAVTSGREEPPPGTEVRLAAFTEIAATAIANSQAREELRAVADEQAALRRVATLVAEAAAPGEVFAAVAEEVGRLLAVDDAAVWRYLPDGTGEIVSAWSQTGEAIPVGFRAEPVTGTLTGTVRETGRPARVDRYTDEAGGAAREIGIRSSVGAPIVLGGELWGLVAVVSTGEEPPPPGTEERLAGFTELVATAIGNAEAREELRTVADEQAALGRVATLVARGEPPAGVFAAVAEQIGRLLETDDALVVRFEPDESVTIVASWTATGEPLRVGHRRHVEPGEGLTPLVRETGRSARIDSQTSYYSELGVESAVAAPITVEGRIWGVIGVALRGREPAPPDTEERLAAFTGLVATAIANAESREQLMASRARIVAAADQARRRIERDLHDGAQQRLASLVLRLRTAQADVPPELRELGGELDRAVVDGSGALEELQEIARGIHPAILAKGGLGAAVKTLARRSAVPVQVDVRSTGRLPEPVEVAAYYVVSEALTNVAKHARASAVTVTVEADTEDSVLRVAVCDDGVGGADLTLGTGLIGLKDRVEALGGRILLDSPRSAGTSLRVELPLTATNARPTAG
ncbi:MAG TPA: GAF domain-containing protein [Gemmatimonadales bacterium]|nr:GAF domain-containing protein [Gemmatimonadales bacterium]